MLRFAHRQTKFVDRDEEPGEAPREVLRAYYNPRIEGVRRCRAILERAL